MKNKALLTHSIISAAIAVHRHIGPGCWSQFMSNACALNSIARGINFQRQVLLPVNYDWESN